MKILSTLTMLKCIVVIIRVRGRGRQGRSGDSRHQVPECSEYSDSEDVFVDCQGRKLSSIPTALCNYNALDSSLFTLWFYCL